MCRREPHHHHNYYYHHLKEIYSADLCISSHSISFEMRKKNIHNNNIKYNKYSRYKNDKVKNAASYKCTNRLITGRTRTHSCAEKAKRYEYIGNLMYINNGTKWAEICIHFEISLGIIASCIVYLMLQQIHGNHIIWACGIFSTRLQF